MYEENPSLQMKGATVFPVAPADGSGGLDQHRNSLDLNRSENRV